MGVTTQRRGIVRYPIWAAFMSSAMQGLLIGRANGPVQFNSLVHERLRAFTLAKDWAPERQ